jgi:hypothetical protein
VSNRKHDYDLLEREYISGTMSLRQLAKDHGMSHSLVMTRSTKDKWADKRETFRSQASESAVTFMADRRAYRISREMEVRDKAIDVIEQALDKLSGDMGATHDVLRGTEVVTEPVYRLRPNDIVPLLDRLQVMFGKPSIITEERSLGVTVDTGPLEPETLREFIEATRGVGPFGGATQESPLPRSDRTRKN